MFSVYEICNFSNFGCVLTRRGALFIDLDLDSAVWHYVK